MRKIFICGAGQLGSRYLQGLASVVEPLDIAVVDLSPAAIDTAAQRWVDVNGDQAPHRLQWASVLPESTESFDIAIIATSSRGRADLVADLATRISVRYWILEKVLTQSSLELQALLKTLLNVSGAWVNTPRRLMRWYGVLKERFSDKGPLRIEMTGGSWGLACNSIHFIDLVVWWTGETLTDLNTGGLERVWVESKRAGYYEVNGILDVTFSGGSTLRLSARPEAGDTSLHITTSDGTQWLIDEARGTAVGPAGVRIDGALEYQSSMTAGLVRSILKRGTCGLPTLVESAAQHEVFLDAMLAHWNCSQNRNDAHVPLT